MLQNTVNLETSHKAKNTQNQKNFWMNSGFYQNKNGHNMAILKTQSEIWKLTKMRWFL